MKNSFLSTLLAVLTNQPKIDALPNNRLVAFEAIGPTLEHPVSDEVFLKIARLQTLCVQSHASAEMPSYESLKEIGDATSGDTISVMAHSLGVQEDGTRRLMMLERLILEVIREAVPAECEVLDVEYYAHISKKIMRRSVQRQRFLD